MEAAKEAWESQQWNEGAIASLSMTFAPRFFVAKDALRVYMRKKAAFWGAEGFLKDFSTPASFPNLEHLFAAWINACGFRAIAFLLRHVDDEVAFIDPVAEEVSIAVGNALADMLHALTPEAKAAMKDLTTRELEVELGVREAGDPTEEICADVSHLLVIEEGLAPFVIRVIEACANPHAYEVLLDEARIVASHDPKTPSPDEIVDSLMDADGDKKRE